MSSRRSTFRRRDKSPFERFKDHFRKFTAFMFSNVGIILLVTFYIIGGAFIFQAIEIFEYERLQKAQPHKFIQRNYTADFLRKIWETTIANISFDKYSYKKEVDAILLDYQQAAIDKYLLGKPVEEQWTFSGSFLYSLTVITTIGYGNISPKSVWGKLVTILYAIIGMPLFLLYLSNIGDVLAKSFKWIYSKVCLCRICPGVARRRIIRERRKLRRIAMSKALHDLECGSDYSSTSNSSSTSTSTNSCSDETKSSTQTTSALEKYYDEENDTDIENEIQGSTDEITVPLTVCIMIMISYILSGAILFGGWETWGYLDGSYFCFISLSSIGFGDLVPGAQVMSSDKDKVSFILCAGYLLLGMALIAMCFNLMQEQVIHNMRSVKRAFKACFRCRSC